MVLHKLDLKRREMKIITRVHYMAAMTHLLIIKAPLLTTMRTVFTFPLTIMLLTEQVIVRIFSPLTFL